MYGFIYITTNNINGKKYIGQKKYGKDTKWESYLGSGICLKRAIDKYGEGNFSREIIEECETQNELNTREIYWINFYNAVESDLFYNIASGGDGGNTIAGYTTEERKIHSRNKSLAFKGKINQRGNNPGAKKVICLNTMEIFNCTTEAEEFYGISHGLVQKVCNPNERSVTAGIHPITNERLQWEYYYEDKEYHYIPHKRDYFNPIHNRSIKVYCIELDMYFDNVKSAAKYLGLSPNNISTHLSGKASSVGKIKLGKEYHFNYA